MDSVCNALAVHVFSLYVCAVNLYESLQENGYLIDHRVDCRPCVDDVDERSSGGCQSENVKNVRTKNASDA